MKIDKVIQQLTAEEAKRRKELCDEIFDYWHKKKVAPKEVVAELDKLNNTARRRYGDRIKNNPKLLLEDIEEILNALTKEDHNRFIRQQKDIAEALAITIGDLKEAKQAGESPEDHLIVSATDTPEGARSFIASVIGAQANVIGRAGNAPIEYLILQKLKEWYSEKDLTGIKERISRNPKDTPLEKLIQLQLKEWAEEEKRDEEEIKAWLSKAPTHFSTFQNTATNTYTALSKRVLEEDLTANKGTYKANNVVITIDDLESTTLTPQASKVLQIVLKDLTANISQYSTPEGISSPDKRRVVLTLKDYMKLCGLKDPKNARQQLNNAINTLYHSSLTFKQNIYNEKGRKPEKHTFDIHILSGRERNGIIKNGKVELLVNADFAFALCHSSIMDFPTCLLTVREKKNPSSFNMGQKIATHHRMNKGKKNSNRISVKSLLAVCTELPTYKEEREKNSQVTDHIIEPFERDLIALKEDYHLLKKWNYCNHKGAPLTDQQIENYSYAEWINWLIDFELEEN